MQAVPVQVTVVEYVSEFFRKYKRRAYGRTISLNAKGGADALMGMLKLVLAKGGRDELRIALHCFKDQLTAASHSVAAAPSVRSQQVEELFALLSSLIDAAEKLRQFSPVKETISAAVLEEVRWRLFRVIVGDGFSDNADIRRRALDIVFLAYMREQNQHMQQQQRHKQLAAAAAGQPGAAGAPGRPGSPSKAARLLQRKAGGGLSGPDVSSWEGLWSSLGVMSGRRMLPLLQSVMSDLYLGQCLPGTPATAAAASGTQPAAATASGNSKLPQAAARQQLQQRQQQQQQLPRSSSEVSAAAASSSSAIRPITIAVVPAGSAAASDDSSCGVSTPPQRSSDIDQQATCQQQAAEGSSGAGGDAAAVSVAASGSLDAAAAAADQPTSPSKQQQQHHAVVVPSIGKDARCSSAAETDTDAAGVDSPTALEAMGRAAAAATGQEPAWVSCASSSYCPTDGSIDETSIASSSLPPPITPAMYPADSVPAGTTAAAGDDGSSGAADTAAAAASTAFPAVRRTASACTSPTSGSNRKGLAAKFKEFKDSVKEIKENMRESVASAKREGAGSSRLIPRAWVQFNHHNRQGVGLDREQEQHQQQRRWRRHSEPADGDAEAAAAAVCGNGYGAAVGEPAAAGAAVAGASSQGHSMSPGFGGEEAADWSCGAADVAMAAAPAVKV